MNMSTFTNVTEMKYWCYKVLPLVYDDSLSYYEVLCKATEKLNEVIENNNNIPEYIKEVVAEGGFFDQIQEQIAELNDGTSATATADRFTGELIWLNGNLYRITRNMLAGDQYVTSSEGVTGNIEKLTFEQWCERYRGLIKASITSHDEKHNSESSQTYSVDDWMWWQGAFYTVIKDIAEGDRLVVGRNVQTSDLEQLIGGKIKKELAEIKVLIQNETDARTEADKVLTDSIAQEVSNRSDADTKLQSELDTEVSNRSDADKVLTDSVAQEVSNRSDADAKLQSELETEVSNRSDADKVLTDSVAQEVSDRSALIEKDGDTTVVKGEPVKINTASPLQYGSVESLTDYFGTVSMTDKTGVSYKLLTQTSLTEKLKESSAFTYNFYDIRNYGGTGDGTTNDTTAFNTCLQKNGNVYLPEMREDGTFYKWVLDSITLTNNQNVVGDGSSKIIHTGTAPLFIITGSNVNISGLDIFFDSTGGNCVLLNSTSGLEYIFISNIVTHYSEHFLYDTGSEGIITNVFLDKISCRACLGTTIYTSKVFAFFILTNVTADNLPNTATWSSYQIENCEGARLTNCEAEGGLGNSTSLGSGHGFLFTNCKAIWLVNCMADYCSGNGFYMSGSANHYFYFLNCVSSLCLGHGYLLNGTTVIVSNCFSNGRKGQAGTVIAGTNGFYSFASDITISGCVASYMTSYPLAINGGTNVNVGNSTFTHNTNGIYYGGSAYGIVHDCCSTDNDNNNITWATSGTAFYTDIFNGTTLLSNRPA